MCYVHQKFTVKVSLRVSVLFPPTTFCAHRCRTIVLMLHTHTPAVISLQLLSKQPRVGHQQVCWCSYLHFTPCLPTVNGCEQFCRDLIYWYSRREMVVISLHCEKNHLKMKWKIIINMHSSIYVFQTSVHLEIFLRKCVSCQVVFSAVVPLLIPRTLLHEQERPQPPWTASLNSAFIWRRKAWLGISCSDLNADSKAAGQVHIQRV